METPSSTCDEGSELDARSQSDYADFDDLDLPPRGRHRREPSSDASSECSGEPGSPYASSPYPRWPVCTLPARVPPPAAPLLKRLGTTRRGARVGACDGKAGDGGTTTLFLSMSSAPRFCLLGEVTRIICCDEFAELQLIKERFSKLLLGEDMSGSGKGVSTSVAISNAITNLYGQRPYYPSSNLPYSDR
jgi:hypothetical protein